MFSDPQIFQNKQKPTPDYSCVGEWAEPREPSSVRGLIAFNRTLYWVSADFQKRRKPVIMEGLGFADE